MATEVSNIPGKANLKAYQNDTFTKTITLTEDSVAVDLSGADNITLQVRAAVGDTVLFTFELGDGASVGGVDNNVITLSKIVDIDPGSYLYDLEIVHSATNIQTILKGSFTVQADITRI